MKFTHQDVESDRKLPVGSLFTRLMDEDAQVRRAHHSVSARRGYERTLAHTSLDLYEDKNECFSRTSTPVRGRRHFPAREREQAHFNDTNAKPFLLSPCRRRTMSAHSDQLGRDLRPINDAAPEVRGRRFIAEPRGEEALSTEQQRRIQCARRVDTALRHRRLSAASLLDHLSLSTLVPQPETPKPRPVPPPLIVRPRHTGLKHFPERRSASVDSIPHGVRRVPPPPHFRSVADRQWDFLELGAGCNEFRQPRRRCVPSTNIFNISPTRPTTERHVVVPRKQQDGNYVAAPFEPRCYGRARANAPQRRTYDIITGRPLRYS